MSRRKELDGFVGTALDFCWRSRARKTNFRPRHGTQGKRMREKKKSKRKENDRRGQMETEEKDNEEKLEVKKRKRGNENKEVINALTPAL